MSAFSAGRKRNWSPLVIGALAAAAVLLAAGVLMAVYQEQLYSAQQVKDITEQARILAASVTAAIAFDDRNAAGEYVEALAVNPELLAAGVYDGRGRRLAQFHLPLKVRALCLGERDLAKAQRIARLQLCDERQVDARDLADAWIAACRLSVGHEHDRRAPRGELDRAERDAL